MQKTNKKRSFASLLALCLSVVMILTLFVTPVFVEGEPEKQTCKVTVTNGASSADIVGEAYNSIHVYDSTEGHDDSDFTGEKTFDLGTKIDYYVWPQASDIQLTVVHNGKTVEDKVYAQGETGEPVTIVLEGDLEITTRAITSESTYTVTIDQTTIPGDPEIYLDSARISNGAEVSSGEHSFYIYGDYITDELSEAYVTLLINGKQIGEPQQIGMSGAEFENVSVNGNVVIMIGELKDEPAKEYKVSVEKGEDVPGDFLIYMDTTEVDGVVSAEEGEHDFIVYGDYTDNQDAANITILVNGVKVSQVMHASGYDAPAEFSGIKVDGDVVISIQMPKFYSVSYDNKTKEENIIFTVAGIDNSGEFPMPLLLNSGDKLEEGEYLGARVINPTDQRLKLAEYDLEGKEIEVIYIDPADENGEEGANGIILPAIASDVLFVLDYAPDVYKVTVNNGAASANTDSHVNGLHVYKAPAEDDVEDTAYYEKGTAIEIYAYPLASAVNVSIWKNGEEIYNYNLHQMNAWIDDDKTVFKNINLDGDLVVTTRAISAYNINIENKVTSDQVDFTIGTVDWSGEAPQQVVLHDGDKALEGDFVAARAINDSDKVLALNTYGSDDVLLDSVLIMPGDANGFMIPSLSSDVKFTLEETTVPLETLKLLPDAMDWTGQALKPNVAVTANINGEDVTLKENIDYTIDYTNNVKVGKKATVKITGIGNFTGTLSKKFTINAAKQTIKVKQTTKQKTVTLKYSKVKKKAQTVKFSKVAKVTGAKTSLTYKKTKGNNKITVNPKNGTITVKKGLKKGTYTVKIKVSAKKTTNYKASNSKTITVKVKVK